MQKVRLEISGIAYSQTQSGSYVLTLSEAAGNRKLPIVIGGFEAQAIAVELEKMIPNRPLTHDLIKSFYKATGIPIILNTSFNINNEPIVETPEDALRTFFSSGADILYLGNYKVIK